MFIRTVRFKLVAGVTLLSLGVASAHVIPLDVTLQAQGSAVLAHIVSPDGLNVSGVKLDYQLGSAAPVAFRETAAGQYTAPLAQAAPTVNLTLIDATFKGEESQVTGQTVWPPTPTQALRIPARPLTSQSFTLSPALIVPTVLALLIVLLVWRALQRSQTPRPSRLKAGGED
jgi:hypothetical protein